MIIPGCFWWSKAVLSGVLLVLNFSWAEWEFSIPPFSGQMGTLAFIFFPSPYNAFPIQATHEGFFLKCLVKTLKFLIFFLSCPACWFISNRTCQVFQSHPVRREKKIKCSSRGWRDGKGLDSYSQFSLMIRSSLAWCYAGAHLDGDLAQLGCFGLLHILENAPLYSFRTKAVPSCHVFSP